MDCHDFATAKSRNDGKNREVSKVDSRISKETSADAERCPLFCDEKSGFFKRVQGRILKRM